MGKGEKGEKDLSFKIFIGKITKYLVNYFQICTFCGKKGIKHGICAFFWEKENKKDLTKKWKGGIIFQNSDEMQGRKDEDYEWKNN